MSVSEIPVSTKPASTDDYSHRIPSTIGYFAAFVALGLAEATLGPTLRGLATNIGASLREISFVFVARSLGYLLGAFLGGQLYDRVSGHWVMAAMLVTVALTMALSPVMPALWLLIAVLLVLGIAQSTLDVGGNTLLVWVHRRQVGPYMNGLHFFFGVGAFLAPVVVAQAKSITGDITWAYWVLALFIFPVALWMLRLPSPRWLTATDHSSDGRINYGLVTLLAVFFSLFVGAEVSFGGWISTYTVALNLAAETSADYLTSAYWGSLTVARLLSIPLAAHFRPRSILLADLLAGLASLSLILLWPGSITVLWLGTLGVGFALASIFPTTISLAERHLTVTGRVTSWFIVGGSIGSMFFPWLIGQMFEPVGPPVMIWTISAIILAALVIFGLLMYAIQVGPSWLKGPAEP
jgi:FHS family Na+ dependent glucose MFS transporter 1